MPDQSPTNPKLVWTRSDGDSSRWPTKTTPSTTEPWFEPVDDVNHRKYVTYSETAGEHLAGVLGIPKLAGERDGET